MKSPQNDYLKFWRVIRYYMKSKYQVSQADLDIILFLYSEGYFGEDRFNEFAELVTWEVHRFERLRRDGWIELFRRKTTTRKALYQLTNKARNMVFDIYRKLNGEEIPSSLSANKMFHKNVCYNDKVYRNMIIQMNAYQKANPYRTPKIQTKEEEDD